MLTFPVSVPSSLCPTCGNELNAASSTTGTRSPRPGDISVCIHCGAFLSYQPDITLKLLTEEELVEISAEDPEAIITLNRVREAVRKYNQTEEKTHEA